jgi:hypothetical protein
MLFQSKKKAQKMKGKRDHCRRLFSGDVASVIFRILPGRQSLMRGPHVPAPLDTMTAIPLTS